MNGVGYRILIKIFKSSLLFNRSRAVSFHCPNISFIDFISVHYMQQHMLILTWKTEKVSLLFPVQGSLANKRAKLKLCYSSAYIKRVIAHPSFHNIDFKAAEGMLAEMDQGDTVIRPSSKGMVCMF